MPASLVLRDPWPERTPEPRAASKAGAISPRDAAYRLRVGTSKSKLARQIVADQSTVAAAKTQCETFSGNEVMSCFPTADIVIPQHQWATFVWNSNNPLFVQSNRVDVYLFHGDSLQQIFRIPNLVNPKNQAGSVTAQVNDSWWGTRGSNWAGQNISYPFYWLIQPAGESLTDGLQRPQATFSAVQTTFADSVVSSMLSSSSVASLASKSASLASVSLSLAHQTATTTTSAAGGFSTGGLVTGSVQASTGDPFPSWAIGVIVVGLVLLVSVVALMLFGIYYLRERERHRGGPYSQTGSPLSGGPDMAQADEAIVGGAIGAGGGNRLARESSTTSHGHRTSQSLSHGHSQRTTSPDSALTRAFSGADAAIMAQAFRKELRHAGGPLDEEEEDPEGARTPVRHEHDTLL
ncbi:unnamed protein product [Mycena citricolor]|uniref:Uncharacterized protein n=1 Tax=Mycena citricolor TaxID=2018698 RepID=A0AAD2H4D1_9AGAR|nr:unnamed protein product [Mycena citricolor]